MLENNSLLQAIVSVLIIVVSVLQTSLSVSNSLRDCGSPVVDPFCSAIIEEDLKAPNDNLSASFCILFLMLSNKCP